MMSHFSRTAPAIAAGIILTAPAFATDWMTDLPAACEQARKEGKAVLVDFTGSDWCGWCVRMRSTILNAPAFREYAADKFVLMEVDVPKNVAKIGAELHAKNTALARRYAVTAYPTILVLNPDGEVMGGLIGGRDRMENVIAPLNEALQNKTALEAARRLKGVDKAQALFAVYSAMQPELRKLCKPLRDEIAAADPKNTTGIHDEIRDTARMEKLQADIAATGTDFERGMARFEQELKDCSEANRALIIRLRSDYLSRCRDAIIMQADSKEDILKLKQVLLLMANDLTPQEAADIKREIETEFADPEAVLQMLREKQKH